MGHWYQVIPRKIDAAGWARSIEHRFDAGEHVPSTEACKRTLADAIDRFLRVTLSQSKFHKNSREQPHAHLVEAADGLSASTIAGARATLATENLTHPVH